jgi:serine protease
MAVWAIGVAACIALAPAEAHAADIHVPGQFPSIQAALDAAAPGDTVLVGPGEYTESLNFLGKDVRVQSTDGPAVTTIRVVGGTAVRIGPAGAFVGFTVTGAAVAFGSGVEVSGAGTLVQGNVFVGNLSSGGDGAAIGGTAASPTIDRNVFRHNSCGPHSFSGVISFVHISSPRITNNLFIHNSCTAINMDLSAGSTPEVINNTMWDNRAGIRVEAGFPTALQVYRNNLIFGNEIGLQVDIGSPTNNPTWEHNLVSGNTANYLGIADQTGIAGNISARPQFVGAPFDDYHLALASPGIDAGAGEGAPSMDFDGNPRPIDGDGNGIATVDIGAYEVQEVPPPLDTEIDVRPHTSENRISLRSREPVPVAILSIEGIEATTDVTLESLTFGRTGDEPSLARCDEEGRDVNRDSRLDLVCHFDPSLMGFQPDDTRGILKGRILSGRPFVASDAVQLVS